MIKKQDVLNLIADMKSHLSSRGEDETAEAVLDMVMNKVEGMEETGEWIPVERELPEPGKIVLVNQAYSWMRHEDSAEVTIGRLTEGENPHWEWQYYRPDFKHGSILDNGIICPGSEYVTAWMPRPEPYREVES